MESTYHRSQVKNSKNMGEKHRACFCCQSGIDDPNRRHKTDIYGENIGYREYDIQADQSDSGMFKRHYKCYNCNNEENIHKNCACKPPKRDSTRITKTIRPEIYHSDSENDTNVRKSPSRIKWGRPGVRPPKKSRYHKRCAEKSYRKPPKRHAIKKNTLISDEQVESILIAEAEGRKKFKNECYCLEKVQKPKVTNPVTHKKRHNLKHRDRSPSACSLYGLETLKKANDVIKYSPESQFLRRIKNEAKSVFKCSCEECMSKNWETEMKYTENRAAVEKSYSDTTINCTCSCYRKHNCEQNCRKSTYVRVPSNSPSSTIVNLLNEESNKNYACGNIKNAGRIRKENFFETHSTEDLRTRPHTCIHKFELDSRLLPKPLNTDPYGTSRCTICAKPMKYERKTSDTSTKHHSTGNLKGLSEGSSYTNKLCLINPKSCLRKSNYECSISATTQSGLASTGSCIKKINIGSTNDIIDINIEPEKYQKVRFRPNVVPHNSLALRYQKGVI